MTQYNKRPGRPKAPEEDRIQYRISAKFSLKEILSLKKKAESDGISLYEYMRQALLTAEVHPRIKPEEMTAYKALSMEIRNIGVNLNLIAKKAVSSLSRNYDADIASAMKSLEDILTTFKKKLI
ncbi:MAG: hypothetical protein Q4G10_08775 [Bacteroidia bacterium]|nr:hypothetical protein [Bacteroidia bacterium]